MDEDAYQLLASAPRIEGSPYVCPSVFDGHQPMSEGTYKNGWTRILDRAEVPHVGTHGIRHRVATDIANSGVSVKIGMALTAHKAATMFMRYVHAEDNPVRQAAERVANLRKALVAGGQEKRDLQAMSGAAEKTGGLAWGSISRIGIAECQNALFRLEQNVPTRRRRSRHDNGRQHYTEVSFKVLLW